MNGICPHFQVRLEPKPCFYQDAMYVRYGITVAMITKFGLILNFLGNPSEWVFIGVVMACMVLIAP